MNQGRFLGVCGDHRFVNDFATAQISQALLDLWELTKEEKKPAAIKAARMYVFSIYAHPVPNNIPLKGWEQTLQGWQYTHAGLGFEHGGSIGSASNGGPILLASHTGMFVRIAQITGNPFFAELARAAAWGRDAHVNSKNKCSELLLAYHGSRGRPVSASCLVADRLVNGLPAGGGRLPQQRPNTISRRIYDRKSRSAPSLWLCRRFIFGDRAQLIFNPDAVKGLASSTDLLMAKSTQGTSVYLIFLQNDTEAVERLLQVDIPALLGTSEATYGIWTRKRAAFQDGRSLRETWNQG